MTIIKKISRILLAWWYVVISHNNELSRTRLVICAHCEHRKRFVCGLCMCPLIAKSRLEAEECPAGYWPDERRLFKQ